MAKFKVGQWVRVVDNGGAPRDFSVGEIVQITSISGNLVRAKGAGMFDYRFEPWQPKVGERVRFACDSKAGGARFGAKGEAATVVRGLVESKEPYLTVQLDGGASRLAFAPAAYLSDVEPFPVNAEAAPAAPLKIEAGKYYRTRDGRKVGPADTNPQRFNVGNDAQGLVAVARLPEIGDVDASGAWLCGFGESRHDLIAKWVEEAPIKAIVSTDHGPVVKTEPKFKVGDVVYAVDDEKDHGTVAACRNGRYAVHWRSHGSSPSDDVIWNDNELTLVTPTTTAIVCVIEGGQPKPATRPFVHPSREAATKEAKRLADKHVGQEFGVYILADSVITKPFYAHEWQRLAKSGQKGAAIRIIQDMTGMNVEAARAAITTWARAA